LWFIVDKFKESVYYNNKYGIKGENKMRAIALAVIFAVFASSAYAGQVGRVTSVQINYRTEVQQRVVTGPCYNQRIPIYGGSGGDVLAGAIIGGAIGGSIGNGSDRDAAIALGAILGANVGSRSRVVAWQDVYQCDDRISEHYIQVQDGYLVSYTVNGRFYSFYTYEQFSVGDRVIHR